MTVPRQTASGNEPQDADDQTPTASPLPRRVVERRSRIQLTCSKHRLVPRRPLKEAGGFEHVNWMRDRRLHELFLAAASVAVWSSASCRFVFRLAVVWHRLRAFSLSRRESHQ